MTMNPFQARDPFQQQDKEKLDEKRKLKKKKEIEDLKKVLSTEEGKNVLYKIVSRSKFFELSFTGNVSTYFNEGQREVGRQIMNDISQVSPEHLADFVERAFKKDIE